MMNFKQWQVINETYGRFTLGVKTPRSVGAVGSKLAEMGIKPSDMADDLSGGGMDLGMSPIDMGGMDDMGADPMGGMGMGADPMGGMGMDDMGADPMGGMGMDDMGADPLGGMGGMGGMGGKITIDDLDPSLLALLGLDKEMGLDSPEEGGEDDEMGMFGGEGDDGEEGHAEPDGDEGSPFGGVSDDDGDGDDDDSDDEGEDAGPFGGKGSGSSSKDSDSDGETDDTDDDDDNDGETDDTDDDDDNDGVEDKADDDKKKGSSSKEMYSKKFMGKGMKPCCNNEDASFLNSLTSMGRGSVRQTFESGVPRPVQKRRLEPKPGEIGYAPQGRVAQNWPSVTEWAKKRSK